MLTLCRLACSLAEVGLDGIVKVGWRAFQTASVSSQRFQHSANVGMRFMDSEASVARPIDLLFREACECIPNRMA